MKRQYKKMMLAAGCLVLAGVMAAGGCGRRNPKEDLRGELAAIAGSMAADKDLREIMFRDLNHDGEREVILVFGPRELLNFDVFYREENGQWKITPTVNDQNNPREFVNTQLESIGQINGDSLPEITVSSRLYDGNTMVKEIRWSPSGYTVVNQRTVLAGRPLTPKKTETARPSGQAGTIPSGTTQKAEPKVAAASGRYRGCYLPG